MLPQPDAVPHRHVADRQTLGDGAQGREDSINLDHVPVSTLVDADQSDTLLLGELAHDEERARGQGLEVAVNEVERIALLERDSAPAVSSCCTGASAPASRETRRMSTHCRKARNV
ncbi:MAG TPA: hypothetical protein VHU19_18355 [Pyrinomonadaceae bacterium]|jgi:hypothetical protein|nr:hypothetical protein [Pyrinomonadaceae bacterium]